MHHRVTSGLFVRRHQWKGASASLVTSTRIIMIDGAAYFPADYVAREIGVSRQTLWRWRRQARIPAGNRYRDKQVVFTDTEFALVRAYAYQIAPITLRSTASDVTGVSIDKE